MISGHHTNPCAGGRGKESSRKDKEIKVYGAGQNAFQLHFWGGREKRDKSSKKGGMEVLAGAKQQEQSDHSGLLS